MHRSKPAHKILIEEDNYYATSSFFDLPGLKNSHKVFQKRAAEPSPEYDVEAPIFANINFHST